MHYIVLLKTCIMYLIIIPLVRDTYDIIIDRYYQILKKNSSNFYNLYITLITTLTFSIFSSSLNSKKKTYIINFFLLKFLQNLVLNIY